MKRIAAFIAAISLSSVAVANPYDWKILKVADGDTVVFEARTQLRMLRRFRLN